MYNTTIQVSKDTQEDLAIIKAVERKGTYDNTVKYLIDKYYNEKLHDKEQLYKV